MKLRGIIRAALLLTLVLALTLEAALWLRAVGISWLQIAYPSVGVDADDSPVYWRQFFRQSRGEVKGYVWFFDQDRNVTERFDYRHLDRSAFPELPRLSASPRVIGRAGPWERFEDPEFVLSSTRGEFWDRPELRWSNHVRSSLNSMQNGRLHWTFEAGRFTCRAWLEGAPVATFGPDSGEFGRLEGLYVHHRGEEPARIRHLLFDPDEFVLHDIRIERAPDPEQPSRVSIETVPVREAEGVAGDERLVMGLIRTDTERLLVDEKGRILARAPRVEGESVVCDYPSRIDLMDGHRVARWATMPESVPLERVTAAVATLPKPVDPLVVRHRFRIVRVGQPEKVVETRLEPITTLERLLAGLALAPEVARPFPLAVVSSLSAPPDTWEECNAWWLRTPSLADGARPGLLALIAIVSVAVAWLAYRWGRVRCATVRQARLWAVAVFLVGPLGLLWMRLVLPRVRVDSVGGARRAVNLDAAPSTEAPWPAPVSTGVEVVGV